MINPSFLLPNSLLTSLALLPQPRIVLPCNLDTLLHRPLSITSLYSTTSQLDLPASPHHARPTRDRTSCHPSPLPSTSLNSIT